jgi:hypothetical protein
MDFQNSWVVPLGMTAMMSFFSAASPARANFAVAAATVAAHAIRANHRDVVRIVPLLIRGGCFEN